MEEIKTIVQNIKADIENGRPEEELFQSILSLLEKPEVAARVVEELSRIPRVEIVRLLNRMLGGSGQKQIRKAIKRSLYRLKQKGISVEEPPGQQKGPVLRPLKGDPPKGFGGPLDPLGNQFLVLAVPHAGRGWAVIQGIISDTLGLVDFSGGEMSRKGFRRFTEEVQKEGPFPMVEMESSYAALRFVQAYHLTLEKGKTPPQDYFRLRSEIERIKKEYERPLIYGYFQEREFEGDDGFLRGAGDLLEKDFFGNWKVQEDEIRPYVDQIMEAEVSKLILNQAQKEARFQEIYQRALSDLFPEEKRSLYQRRMEEMAYILLKLRREEEAKISFAVALDLKKPANLIQPNPFLFRLVVKSIFALLAEARDSKTKEPSFILKP